MLQALVEIVRHKGEMFDHTERIINFKIAFIHKIKSSIRIK